MTSDRETSSDFSTGEMASKPVTAVTQSRIRFFDGRAGERSGGSPDASALPKRSEQAASKQKRKADDFFTVIPDQNKGEFSKVAQIFAFRGSFKTRKMNHRWRRGHR